MTDNLIRHKKAPHTGLRDFQPHDAKIINFVVAVPDCSATAPQLMQVQRYVFLIIKSDYWFIYIFDHNWALHQRCNRKINMGTYTIPAR